LAIQDIPVECLKFCDESHFNNLRQCRGRSRKGEPVVVASDISIKDTYSITVVTTLTGDQPLFVSAPRVGSNEGDDFLEFVLLLVEEGVLTRGDYFIIDNASIHWTRDNAPLLVDMLQSSGVRLIFLPTYSPELNPCELVFAQVKRFLREHRGDLHFIWEIMFAFSTVDFDDVRAYYDACIAMEIS